MVHFLIGSEILFTGIIAAMIFVLIADNTSSSKYSRIISIFESSKQLLDIMNILTMYRIIDIDIDAVKIKVIAVSS